MSCLVMPFEMFYCIYAVCDIIVTPWIGTTVTIYSFWYGAYKF